MELSSDQIETMSVCARRSVVEVCGYFDEDLYQEVWIAMMKWAPKYDPSTGWKFSTFMRKRARGAVIDAIRIRDGRADLGRVRPKMESLYVSNEDGDEDERAELPPAYIETPIEDREIVLTLMKSLTYRERRLLCRLALTDATLFSMGCERGVTESMMGQHLKSIRAKATRYGTYTRKSLVA